MRNWLLAGVALLPVAANTPQPGTAPGDVAKVMRPDEVARFAVHRGMSVEQVVRILGQPSFGLGRCSGHTIQFYPRSGVSVEFDRSDKVRSVEPLPPTSLRPWSPEERR